MRFIPIILISFLSPIIMWAQTIPITNLFDNKVFYNPAFVGNNPGVSSVTMTNRLLFRPNSGPLTLNMLIGEYNTCKKPNLGLGLIINQQNEGDGRLKTNLIRPIISYKLKLNESIILTPGFQFNFQNNNIDWSKLVFSDQLDPIQGNIYTSTNTNVDWNSTYNMNVGIGLKLNFYYPILKIFKNLKIHRLFNASPIIYTIKQYGYLGGSINNWGNNNDGLLGSNLIQRTIVLHGALSIPLSNNNFKFNIIPYGRFLQEEFSTNTYRIMDIGGSMHMKNGFVSIGHRNSKSAITSFNSFIFGLAPTVPLRTKQSQALRFSYHIDINYNVSTFANVINHEFSLVYLFNLNGCSQSYKVSICERKDIGILPPF
jgi:type IX secretion system PorP/SprF family membrane protein